MQKNRADGRDGARPRGPPGRRGHATRVRDRALAKKACGAWRLSGTGDSTGLQAPVKGGRARRGGGASVLGECCPHSARTGPLRIRTRLTQRGAPRLNSALTESQRDAEGKEEDHLEAEPSRTHRGHAGRGSRGGPSSVFNSGPKLAAMLSFTNPRSAPPARHRLTAVQASVGEREKPRGTESQAVGIE